MTSPTSPYRASVWRAEDGAALWDTGPHALAVVIALLGPVTAAERLPAPAPYTRFRTRHAGGGEAEISLTLHAPPDRTAQVYRFSGPAGELVLPEPVFERPAVVARAAADLVGMIGSGAREHPCGIGLGLDTVRILAAVERGTALDAAPV